MNSIIYNLQYPTIMTGLILMIVSSIPLMIYLILSNENGDNMGLIGGGIIRLFQKLIYK